MVQLETEKHVGTGVEEICSQFEVLGPVVAEGSVLVPVGAVVALSSSVVTFKSAGAVEVLVTPLQEGSENVFALELMSSAYGAEEPLAHVSPWLTVGSVEEVICSLCEFVFSSVLFLASVIHVDSCGLGRTVSVIAAIVTESVGPGVKAGPIIMVPELEATGSTFEV